MFDMNRARGMVRALVAIGAASLATVATAQVVLPHAFSPGTPARANEVNANFAALRDGVNAHDQAIADLGTLVANLDIQVQALDAEVQALAAATGPRGPELRVGGVSVGSVVDLDIWFGNVTALTNEGWMFVVEAGTSGSPFAEGELLTLTWYYPQAGCVGTPHLANSPSVEYDEDVNPDPAAFMFRTGVVVSSYATPRQALMMQSPAAPTSLRSYFSMVDDICHTFPAPEMLNAIAAAPNVPATTGVAGILGGPVEILPR